MRPLPAAKAATPPGPVAPPPRPVGRPDEAVMASGCTGGEERAIRILGPRFGGLWREMNAVGIGRMFTVGGDIRPPDGTIERGPGLIRQNRAELFGKTAYRGSLHPLEPNAIPCSRPGP